MVSRDAAWCRSLPGQDRKNSPAESRCCEQYYSFSCYILECVVVIQKQLTDTQPNLDVLSCAKSFDQFLKKCSNPRHFSFSVLSLNTTGILNKIILCHLIK